MELSKNEKRLILWAIDNARPQLVGDPGYCGKMLQELEELTDKIAQSLENEREIKYRWNSSSFR